MTTDLSPSLEDRILEIATPLQLWSFATLTEEGLPAVRYVAGKASPDMRLRFSTHLSSRKIAQLRRDPHIHISLGATSLRSPVWLQVEGVARISTEQAERDAFWFEGLKAYVSGVDDPEYAVIIVEPSRVELWQMGQKPEVWASGG